MYEYKITKENLQSESGKASLEKLKLKLPNEIYECLISKGTEEINIETGNETYYIRKLS